MLGGGAQRAPPPNTLKKDEKSMRVLQNSNPQKTRKNLDFKGNSFREEETESLRLSKTNKKRKNWCFR